MYMPVIYVALVIVALFAGPEWIWKFFVTFFVLPPAFVVLGVVGILPINPITGWEVSRRLAWKGEDGSDMAAIAMVVLIAYAVLVITLAPLYMR